MRLNIVACVAMKSMEMTSSCAEPRRPANLRADVRSGGSSEHPFDGQPRPFLFLEASASILSSDMDDMADLRFESSPVRGLTC